MIAFDSILFTLALVGFFKQAQKVHDQVSNTAMVALLVAVLLEGARIVMFLWGD